MISPLDIEYLASVALGCLGLGWVFGFKILSFKKFSEVSING